MRFKLKKSYVEDLRLFEYRSSLMWYLALLAFLAVFPFFAGTYWVYNFMLAGIYSIVALGLNILTGYTGQISLGHAAFYAIGAYTTGFLTTKLGCTFWLALPLAGMAAALIGLIVGIPALRLTGIYLAIATMGFAFIIDQVILEWKYVTNGTNGLIVDRPTLGPISFNSDQAYYYVILLFVVLFVWITKNFERSPTGRAFIAVRDSEVAAQTMGISLAKVKTTAFAISAFYTGFAGGLFAPLINFIGPDNFSIMESINFIVIIIVGGIGSVHGSIFGAIFMTFLSEIIRLGKDVLPEAMQRMVGFQGAVYGLILMAFILFEPLGLYGRWLKIRFLFEVFPLYRRDTFRKKRKFYRSERSR
ncbi:MAG: branched-chain amino acid ABC transporter permease [Desulfobacterales bacterium]|nr:branched-chain amino acid ABC transporter permease [Desulfobacterales bacterium]